MSMEIGLAVRAGIGRDASSLSRMLAVFDGFPFSGNGCEAVGELEDGGERQEG